MYVLKDEIIVDGALDDVWHFIATPANLNKITPPDMSFEIVSDVPEEMYNGLIIEYRVKIPMIGHRRWISEIKHIEHRRRFVDEQLLGPYKFWYHEHIIEQAGPGKVKMIDQVFYRVPFGIFGRLAHPLIVRPQLEKIFSFRRSAFANIKF